jgi:hypothetical protein
MENNIEQMKQDVRTYIALGMHRETYWKTEENQSKKR